MHRLIISAIILLASHAAFAVCPTTPTDCPTLPTVNGLKTAGPIQMLTDGLLLQLSSDGLKTLSYQSSPNAIVLDNAPVQPNFGIQIPDGEPLIMNATEGTAIQRYDPVLGAVRFQNIPVQIDAGLQIPGGNLGVAGTATIGNGIKVVGDYTTSSPLDFSTAQFATGVAAINLGTGNTINFANGPGGFQIGPLSTELAITFNGSPVWTINNNGVMACAGGQPCAGGSGGGGGASGVGLNLVTAGGGAVCDGVTDDAAAINNYLNTFAGTGGLVFIPAGKQCYIGSADLTVPQNVILAGQGGSLNAQQAISLTGGPGLILNPAHTIQMQHSQLRDLFIQKQGLIANPTAGQVISQVATWATDGSIGVNISSANARGTRLSNIFIVGFNTAVLAQGSIYADNVLWDCYNGLELSHAGDNTYITNMRGEPYYALNTSSTSGSWARGGVGYYIHDGNTGTYLTNPFTFMWDSGLIMANTGYANITGSDFECQPSLGGICTTGIRWIFSNSETSVHASATAGFTNAYSIEGVGEVILDHPSGGSATGPTVYMGGQTNTPATVTINGSPVAGNTVRLTITSSAIVGSPIVLPYTVIAGDTITTIAQAQETLVNRNPALIAARFYANNIANVLSVYWPKSVTATVGQAVTGAVTASGGFGAANPGSYGLLSGLDAAQGSTPYIVAGDSVGLTGTWTISAPYFVNTFVLPTNWLSTPGAGEARQLTLAGIPWSVNPTITNCGVNTHGFANGTDISGTIAIGNTTSGTVTSCTVTFLTPFSAAPRAVGVTLQQLNNTVTIPSTPTATGFVVNSASDMSNSHIVYQVTP